jgi:hypothetical protein
MEEIWKDIPNYEGLYKVSNIGNVKSFKFGKERLLKPGIGVKGYLQVVLCKNRKTKNIKVHQLVSMAFLGHTPNGYKVIVDHINNIKTDNRVDNLQLTTNRHNSSKDRVGSTGLTGVFLHKTGTYKALINFNGRLIHLGCFKVEQEAAVAYQNALEYVNNGIDLNILYPRKYKKRESAES